MPLSRCQFLTSTAVLPYYFIGTHDLSVIARSLTVQLLLHHLVIINDFQLLYRSKNNDAKKGLNGINLFSQQVPSFGRTYNR